ncbi:MAG: hypothetical protein ABR902_08825 [Candidatus Korobacteraceae bacterium]|jgi:hypothetical protein
MHAGLRLRHAGFLAVLAIFTVIVAVPLLHAGDDSDAYDVYKLRVDGFWFYSNPSGNFQGSGSTDQIDINHDLGFNSYSTFAGLVDWKFTRKNHLTFAVSPFQQSRQTVLKRTITYQGQTFDVGLTTSANLKANLYAPGYQYDIIRRKRGHLGVAVQMDLFDTKASLMAQAQTTGDGTHHAAISGSGSLLAPIPVAGPQYRLYLTNSSRLFLEGDVYGMYLFGYGNFVSAADTLGLTINKYMSVNAGYTLGSHLAVNDNSTTRIGVRLTQQGALAGLEFSF